MSWGKYIFRCSRRVHRYAGLVILLYGLIMGVSGVLLNHPALIGRVSLPVHLFPQRYTYENWNRMALRDVVFSAVEPATVYVGGKEGVWMSSDGGRHFTALTDGFPDQAYYFDTHCLLLSEGNTGRRLFAGTRSGLYFCDLDDPVWHRAQGRELRNEHVVDLVRVGNRIFAFTPSGCYTAAAALPHPVFRPHDLALPSPQKYRMSLFRFLLQLHSGSLLGLPGRLFVDLIGGAVIFLSLSGLYLWYAPRRRVKSSPQGKSRYLKCLYTHHVKVGIYSACFIIVITLTGMLIWKPVSSALRGYSIPASLLTAFPWADPWHESLFKAVYLPEDNRLLLTTLNGFFEGPAEGPGMFEQVPAAVPIQYVTVLKRLKKKQLLIGSFAEGLYTWDRSSNVITDPIGNHRNNRITAAAVRNETPVFWVGYRQGIVPFEGINTGVVSMPAKVARNGRVSLWGFLLRVHNGKLFRGFVHHYWWIVQIGGLVLLLATLSGTYDYLYRKGLFKRR